MKRLSSALVLVWAVGCTTETTNPTSTCGVGTVLKDGVCRPYSETGTGGLGNQGGGSFEGGGGQSGGASVGGGGESIGGGGGSAEATIAFTGAKSADPISTTAMRLTWDAAAGGSGEGYTYSVYLAKSSGGQAFESANATVMDATSIDIFGLDASSTYYAVVRAQDSNGVFDTNVVEQSVTLVDDASPPTFAGLTPAFTSLSTAIYLQWDSATDDLTSEFGLKYAVYASTTETIDYLDPVLLTVPGENAVWIEQLTPNTEYWFAVRAFDAAGNEDDNEVVHSVSTNADADSPTFSGCTDAIAASATSAVVLWSPASDNATEAENITYKVYVSETPGGQDLTTADATAVGVNSVEVTGLSPEKRYYFVCRAEDSALNQDNNVAQASAMTLPDTTAPTFAGVTDADTSTATSIRLFWNSASDDASESAAIVYDVFVGTTHAGEDFTNPAVTSAPGATWVDVTGLSEATTYYFVVRARDEASNVDTNDIEVSDYTPDSTPIAYSEVQAVFDQSCILCHSGATPPYGLLLDSASSYAATVNIPSLERPSSSVSNPIPLDHIEPESPYASYAYLKIRNRQKDDCVDGSCCLNGNCGKIMPNPANPMCASDPSGACVAPTEEQATLIRDWILKGAEP